MPFRGQIFADGCGHCEPGRRRLTSRRQATPALRRNEPWVSGVGSRSVFKTRWAPSRPSPLASASGPTARHASARWIEQLPTARRLCDGSVEVRPRRGAGDGLGSPAKAPLGCIQVRRLPLRCPLWPLSGSIGPNPSWTAGNQCCAGAQSISRQQPGPTLGRPRRGAGEQTTRRCALPPLDDVALLSLPLRWRT